MAADRTKLDSNFISLVLSMSGRVRPADLHAIPADQRAAALANFYQANSGTMALHFQGEDLVAGSGSGAATGPISAFPEAAPEPAPAPLDPATPAPPVTTAAPTPFDAIPAGEPAPPAEQYVSDYAPVVPAAAGAPATEGSPEMPPAAESDFFAIPPSAPSEPFDTAPMDAAPAEKVSALWWLLPILLTWIGGLIAFFMLRGKSPKAAKAMLITGIAITVGAFLLGVAAAFGLPLLLSSGILG